MRKLLPFALLLIAGCGSDSKPADSSPSPVAEKPKDEVHASAAQPVSVELDEPGMKVFLGELGKMVGHDGWPEGQTKDVLEDMKKFKLNEPKEGPLHIDHEGTHSDVLMVVTRVGEGKFKVEVKGKDAPVLAAIDEKMKLASTE